MAHKRLGFMQLTIILGFSLYYAWYLVTFFSLFAGTLSAAGFSEVHLGQAVFFFGTLIATLGLLGLFNRENSVAIGHTRFLYLASLIPGLALPIFVFVGETVAYAGLPAFYLCCFLSGASAAVGFMLWEDLSMHGYLNRGVLAHSTIFSAGGVLFLLCTIALSRAEAAIASIALLFASTALLAFITPRCDTLENKPVEPVRDYFRSVWNVDIVVCILNAAYGFAFIMLFQLNFSVLLVTMACAIAVDLAFSIAFGRGKWLQFIGGLRICLAFTSCALILFVCLGDFAKAITLGVVVVFWFLFRTINGGSLTDLANKRGFSMLYSSTRGKLATNFGFMVGLGVGVTAAAAPLPDVSTVYVPLALVAAFIIAVLFLLPYDNESPAAGYKSLAIVDMHESSESDMSEVCKAVVTRFKLSPRESEVLTYLVKGRNAKHISEKLFISESTVKTHISNIYRKIGVHSQQELLDALDKM